MRMEKMMVDNSKTKMESGIVLDDTDMKEKELLVQGSKTIQELCIRASLTAFESEGVARVSVSFSEINDKGICQQVFGEVQGLPEQEKGTFIIVSGMVLSASRRTDLVAPASGHSDTVRNEKGHIVSVPCFVSK